MAVYDVICPGLTKERGLTLFELYTVSMHLINKELEGKEVTAQLVDKLRNGLSVLNQVLECLCHERPNTFEHMVKENAKAEQKHMSEFVSVVSINMKK